MSGDKCLISQECLHLSKETERDNLVWQELCFRQQVEQFFAAMDRDFDGRLTLEEFMGEMSPIEKLFILMDKNGDGFVTKKVNVNVLNIPK